MPVSESTTLFIVGDRFADFAEQASARSVSRFVADLRAGVFRDETKERRLVLAEGQGLTSYDWDLIRDELEFQGLSERTVIHRSTRGALGGHTDTHKRREENVLIAGLTRLNETVFQASLRLHNDQEFQLDHQAGHVQGMVVLEAARQMYLAVCERHFAPNDAGHRYAYVFDTLEAGFRNFLFPLETLIEAEVLHADRSDPEMLVFDIQISFRQAGLQAALIRMKGTAFHRALMAKRESRGAQRALRHALRQLPAELAEPDRLAWSE
ncbi:AfsA-related hotdog domain-containing protein [Microbispora siamensis]